MPDNFIQQPQQPSFGDTMATLLGLQQRQQALQTGAYEQQAIQANAEQASQRNTELQAAGNYVRNAINDPSMRDKDGNLDVNKFQQGYLAVAPIYGGDSLDRATSAVKEAVMTRQEVLKLSQQEREDIGQRLTALAANPKTTRSDVLDLIGQLRDEHSGDAGYNRLLDHFSANLPADVVQGPQLNAALQRSVSGLRGIAGQTPSSIDTGTQVQPGTTNQFSGAFTPAGAPVDKEQFASGTNQQPVVQSRNGVRVLPQVGGGAPGSAPPAAGPKLPALQAPSATAPAGEQARYNAQMEQNRTHVNDVSAAASDLQNGVGPTRYRNDQIEDILNDSTFSPTGPGMQQLNWIASRLPGGSGDAFQKLGHYTAQNSAAIAQHMGVPGTNLGAETAAAAAGSTSQNKGALLEVTKVNDAMNTALDMYNRGLQKLTNNGADLSRVQAYRNAFGQAFDMNALRLDDAYRRNDKQEMDRILSSFGPAGSKQRAQAVALMSAHRKTMHSLADTGDLP